MKHSRSKKSMQNSKLLLKGLLSSAVFRLQTVSKKTLAVVLACCMVLTLVPFVANAVDKIQLGIGVFNNPTMDDLAKTEDGNNILTITLAPDEMSLEGRVLAGKDVSLRISGTLGDNPTGPAANDLVITVTSVELVGDDAAAYEISEELREFVVFAAQSVKGKIVPNLTKNIDLSNVPSSSTTGDGWTFTKGEAGAASYYTILDKADVTITGTIADNTYVKVAAGTSTVTLEDASITTNLANTSAFKLESGAVLSLILEGTNTLAAENNDCAGLEVPVGAEVTISGTGTLTARGGYQAAGIGGAKASSGTINIESGTVTAYGGSRGAGIGGGANGNGGTIIINGGTVTAYGATTAAGIGGGADGDGGSISITGGSVSAIASETAAGIGGGIMGNGGNVSITGGSVSATGGASGNVRFTDGMDIGSGGRDTRAAAPAGGTLAVSGGAVLTLGKYGTTASAPAEAPANGKMFRNCEVLGAGAGTLAGIYDKDGNKIPQQTQLIILNPDDGKLHLVNKDGEVALPGVNFTGSYSFEEGVLTLEDFNVTSEYSSSQSSAVNFSGASQIIFNGNNSITQTQHPGYSLALRVESDVVLSSQDDGTFTITSSDCAYQSTSFLGGENTVTLNSGTLICNAGNAHWSYGIFVGAFVLNGGRLKIANGNGVTDEYGPMQTYPGMVSPTPSLGGMLANNSITVPTTGYQVRTSAAGSFTEITSATYTVAQNTNYLEIAPAAPASQTQGLFLDTSSGKLKLGSTSGAAAVQNVDYTGDYEYEDGVLTLTDFHYSTSANIALTIPSDSALTDIAFSGENSLTSTSSAFAGASTAGLYYWGSTSITFGSPDDGTLTLTGGSSSEGTDSSGLYLEEGILTSGTLICIAGDSKTFSEGLAVITGFTVSGGTLICQSGAGSNSGACKTDRGITVPASGYRFRTAANGDWTKITQSTLGGNSGQYFATSTHYLEITPAPQTQGLFLDSTSGKLKLGGTDGEEAVKNVNYSGKYEYKDGVLTLTNFNYSTSAGTAFTIPSDSALTDIVFNGSNSISSTKSSGSSSYGINSSVALNFGSENDGTLALNGSPSVTGNYWNIGLYSTKAVNLSSGTLICTGGNATGTSGTSTGLYSSSAAITITDGTLITKSGNAGFVSRPAYSSSGIKIPGGNYQYRSEEGGAYTPITSTIVTASFSGTAGKYYEITPAPPAPQTQGLFLDSTSGKLKLGGTDGEEAVKNVNYSGKYEYKVGVLTLTNFHFSTSANTALTIPRGSALTEIAYKGANSITS
ncbi:MAG: hypothetical protein LBM65_05850, partial [Oscillospiraceae bacterium]|nr:hypothetical protein [Oscillospiraceae bacterium]